MKKFELIDYNFSDYFKGYHLPVVQIAVSSNMMTREEIAEEIKSELNNCFELYEQWENKEDQKLIDNFINWLNEKPKELYINSQQTREYEEITEDYFPYLYFSFTDRKIVGGIEFLN